MSKELKALENVKREAGTPYFSTLYDIDMWREDFATIEQALLKYEKLCKVINNFYEMAHSGVKHKFDSQALAYFSERLKQLIDNPYEATEDE